MYVPKLYEVKDRQEIEEFIKANPFATVVSYDGQQPIATHIPLELEMIAEEKIVLNGHLAYANPQWRSLAEHPEVLVIFHGPHSYVSSSWYSHLNVPTWNYMAVHVYGTARIVEEERLKEMLKTLLLRYEGGRPNGVVWETLPTDWIENQIKGIVGIEIEINRIQASYKLSQNRDDQDYHAVINQLESSADPIAKHVALEMKKQRPGSEQENKK